MTVPDGLSNADLVTYLRQQISNNPKLSWRAAKTYIYRDLDNQAGFVRGVYSGTTVQLVTTTGKLWPDANGHMQIEHTWPAKAPWGRIGRNTIPGRDLHYLYPTRAWLNLKRYNHPFGVPVKNVEFLRVGANGRKPPSGSGTPTGSQFGLNAQDKPVFRPRQDHRGNTARAMFYISVRYGKPIPATMEAVLKRWHVDDPVDQAEMRRTGRIQQIQNNRNPFVDHPALVARISDF